MAQKEEMVGFTECDFDECQARETCPCHYCQGDYCKAHSTSHMMDSAFGWKTNVVWSVCRDCFYQKRELDAPAMVNEVLDRSRDSDSDPMNKVNHRIKTIKKVLWQNDPFVETVGEEENFNPADTLDPVGLDQLSFEQKIAEMQEAMEQLQGKKPSGFDAMKELMDLKQGSLGLVDRSR